MDPVVDQTIRLGFRVLLFAAGIHKLRHFPEFRQTLDAYRLVPSALVPAVAVLVVAAEIALVLIMGGRDPQPGGLLVAGGLLLAYAGAIALNLWRGRRAIDCGCVGIAGRHGISWWLVGRNVVLAAVALTALVPIAVRPLTWIDRCTVVGATLGLTGLYLATDGLIANLLAYRHLREDA